MLLLPTFNARLQPCAVSAAAFTPHAQGQFCRQCQRVVQDFSHSADPVADLAAARAAAPDGRVCGSFAATQVQRPRLTQRLRWFVVALVLVVGQGLSAREALAQVRKQAHHQPSQPSIVRVVLGDTVLLPEKPVMQAPSSKKSPDKVYFYVEEMPRLPGGTHGNSADIAAFILKSTIIPSFHGDSPVESRILFEFIVTETGEVIDARIIKSITPQVDAAVLKAIYSLPRLLPGRQAGVPVKVRYTMPITFHWQY